MISGDNGRGGRKTSRQPTAFGNVILNALKGKSQSWLARESQVSHTTVSKWIYGDGTVPQITDGNLQVLSRVLKIPPTDFPPVASKQELDIQALEEFIRLSWRQLRTDRAKLQALGAYVAIAELPAHHKLSLALDSLAEVPLPPGEHQKLIRCITDAFVQQCKKK